MTHCFDISLPFILLEFQCEVQMIRCLNGDYMNKQTESSVLYNVLLNPTALILYFFKQNII